MKRSYGNDYDNYYDNDNNPEKKYRLAVEPGLQNHDHGHGHARPAMTPKPCFVKSDTNHIYFNGEVNADTILTTVKAIQSKNEEYEKMLPSTIEDILKDNRYKRADNKFVSVDSKFTIDIQPSPIYLHITSFGGSLLSCMALCDAIDNSKIPIYTVIQGYAASAGTLISVHGKKRFITKNSYMLIHQLASGGSGKYNVLEDNFINCSAFMTRIKNIYLEKTNMTLPEIEDQLRHDHWFDASKCIEVGLADEYYITSKL